MLTAFEEHTDGGEKGMVRRAMMTVAAGLLLCVLAQAARGAYTAFARITPDTEQKHHLYVQILPVDGQPEKCRIIPPKVSEAMGTYLIVCRETLPPEKQSFRSYIWSRGEPRTDIVSVAPLLPCGRYDYEPVRRVIPPKPNPPEI